MLTSALDHLGRPTQIYVHVAVIQRARAKMIGDMAGQRTTASGARTGGVIGEVRDTRSELLDSGRPRQGRRHGARRKRAAAFLKTSVSDLVE